MWYFLVDCVLVLNIQWDVPLNANKGYLWQILVTKCNVACNMLRVLVHWVQLMYTPVVHELGMWSPALKAVCLQIMSCVKAWHGFVALLFSRAGVSCVAVPLGCCWVLTAESWDSGGRGMEMLGAGLVFELGCEVLRLLAACSEISAETPLGFLAGKWTRSERKKIHWVDKQRDTLDCDKYTILPKVLAPLLMKGLSTLVISMSTNLNV